MSLQARASTCLVNASFLFELHADLHLVPGGSCLDLLTDNFAMRQRYDIARVLTVHATVSHSPLFLKQLCIQGYLARSMSTDFGDVSC